MTLPTDSSHLSSQNSDDYLEEFAGMVESQFAADSVMRDYVMLHTIVGTDTKINRRVGRTTLKKITPGVRPDPAPTKYGRTSVTVDTIILARDNQDLLDDFQSDFNVRAELGEDHGKELAKFFDEAFLIQTIKGSLEEAPADLNGAFGAGKNLEFGAVNDELDPDKLEDLIADVLLEMEAEDIDPRDCIVWVRPKHHRVLYKHDKLVDKDFSMANGDYADGTVETIHGARIVKTNRLPDAAITNHALSNDKNGMAYDVSAAESDAIAVIMHPKSLLAGETIPITTDVWFSKEEKQWFIDSFMSFGVSVNRPDVCGAVFKFRA